MGGKVGEATASKRENEYFFVTSASRDRRLSEVK